MLEIKIQKFDDLSEQEQRDAPNNGRGKKNASYLRVVHDGVSVCLLTDALEPEDATFSRGFAQVEWIVMEAYKIGKIEGWVNGADDRPL
jgi:hypothetical protein